MIAAAPAAIAATQSDGLSITLCWIDWLTDESACFDLQEVIEFCQASPDGTCAIQIRNAVGRIGTEQATSCDQPARQAMVILTFGTGSGRAAFAARFPMLAAAAIGSG